MRSNAWRVLAAFIVLTSMDLPAAQAQVERAARVVGTIERLDGKDMVVKTARSNETVRIAPAATVFALVKASLADIRPGVFVGVGAMPQPDGSQRAIRVVIFPESMRGLGEGHRPWDRPGTTMTNATVETAVTDVDGQVLTVRYTGGEKKIVVRPDALVTTYVAADAADLKPGARVTVTGAPGAGGELEARRIVIDRTAVPSG